jgi:GTPase SAR1 family protein
LIVGNSGSGKTTITQQLIQHFADKPVENPNSSKVSAQVAGVVHVVETEDDLRMFVEDKSHKLLVCENLHQKAFDQKLSRGLNAQVTSLLSRNDSRIGAIFTTITIPDSRSIKLVGMPSVFLARNWSESIWNQSRDRGFAPKVRPTEETAIGFGDQWFTFG